MQTFKTTFRGIVFKKAIQEVLCKGGGGGVKNSNISIDIIFLHVL